MWEVNREGGIMSSLVLFLGVVNIVYSSSVIPRPSNLTAEDAREGLFQLSWTQEGVMDEFIIHWKTENGPEYNTSTDSNQIEFNVSDSRITSATWYYISVVAVAGEETSSTSDTLRVGTAPDQPTGVAIKLTITPSVLITWDDQVADLFRIQLHFVWGSLSTNSAVNNYTRSDGLAGFSWYRVLVRAIFDGRNGPWSYPVTIATDSISPPIDVEVIDASESQLTLTWVQVNPPDYYIIYWKTANGPEYNVTTPSDDNSYILNDDSLTPATMYYISVTAVTWYNTSDKSNTTYAGTAPEKPTGLQMKLTSESSIIVTWNHQVADWFTLNLTSNTHSYQQNYITENSYTFTVISASSQYHLQMQAVFDERLSLLSDVITIDDDISFVKKISPLFGPVAGGTNISVTLTCPLSECGDITLYIGDYICLKIYQFQAGHLHTYIFRSVASPVNDSTNLPLSLYINNNTVILNEIFTYKPNPTVSKIQPLSALVTGGVLLTVYGQSLDSVQTATLLVSVVNDDSPGVVEQLRSICRPGDDRTMTCPTPVINIQNSGKQNSGRIVRDTDEEDVITVQGFTFYLGLIFDGFDKYEDTSDFELTVITELPEFEIWEGVTSHESGDILMIQGDNMLTGCTVSDYTVLVGNGTCDDIDVTQNHLQCQPPIEQPGQQSDGHMIDGAVQVVILIGYYKNLVGHLRYDDESGEALSREVIIGIAVGCSLQVLIIAVIILAYCVYRRKHQAQRQNENTRQGTNQQSELVYMPSL